jgi:hypothetical protein
MIRFLRCLRIKTPSKGDALWLSGTINEIYNSLLERDIIDCYNPPFMSKTTVQLILRSQYLLGVIAGGPMQGSIITSLATCDKHRQPVFALSH